MSPEVLGPVPRSHQGTRCGVSAFLPGGHRTYRLGPESASGCPGSVLKQFQKLPSSPPCELTEGEEPTDVPGPAPFQGSLRQQLTPEDGPMRTFSKKSGSLFWKVACCEPNFLQAVSL